MTPRCDRCKLEIELANDRNNVSFNGLHVILCEPCYKDLFSCYGLWLDGKI